MNIEHAGLNVPDPVAAARWYTEHLGMRVLRTSGPPNHAHFLADAPGRMVLEIYGNPAVPVPDYRSMHPLVLHLAFAVDDVRATRTRLLAAGATTEGEPETNTAGDDLAMLRDPWGLALQLVRRGTPLDAHGR
jgi:glyoxylase I family protein